MKNSKEYNTFLAYQVPWGHLYSAIYSIMEVVPIFGYRDSFICRLIHPKASIYIYDIYRESIAYNVHHHSGPYSVKDIHVMLKVVHIVLKVVHVM